MKLGLQIPDFTTPDGPPRLGADLATVARTADEAGFDYIAVMDHFFQIRAIGASESPYHGAHYQLERPLNSPQSLTRPHPPIMIGGGGERKTLRLVAKYADACNLFPTPDLAHKLDVLRAHCDDVGRDYDGITKTCYFVYDVGEKGEKAAEVVDRLGAMAELGFQAAIGGVVNVWQVTPLEVIAAEVIPAVAGL